MVASSPGYVGTQDDVILARVGAFVIDYILSAIIGVALGVGLAIALSSEIGVYIGFIAGLFGYYVVPEGLFGQTVGKRIAGIVVVSKNGDPITFGQSLVRNLLRVVDALFNYALGLVVMLVSDDAQRVGDIAADTVVVRARR